MIFEFVLTNYSIVKVHTKFPSANHNQLLRENLVFIYRELPLKFKKPLMAVKNSKKFNWFLTAYCFRN